AFAGDQAPLSIELESVGLAAGIAKNRGLSGLRIELHDAVADVAEDDCPVGCFRGAFGEVAIVPEHLQGSTRRHDPVLGDRGEFPGSARAAGKGEEDTSEQRSHPYLLYR